MGRARLLLGGLLLGGLLLAGCASAPRAPGETGPARPDRYLHLPPVAHYRGWDDGGSLVALPALLSASFHGSAARADRASPWVYLPPLLYLDHETGVQRWRHVLWPIGYHHFRAADEESTWVVFPFWHSARSRRWLRLGPDELHEIPRREWGLFPLFRVEEQAGVTESVTIWPLLCRYERAGRRRVLRLLFIIPIPLGEETIEEAIRSPVAKVRWDAAREIGERQLRHRAPLLLEAMASGDRVLRHVAYRSLRRITGRRARFRPDDDAGSRARQIERWREILAED